MTEKPNDLIASNDEDIKTLEIDDSGKMLYIGASSIIGKRKDQQDAIKVDSDYSYIATGRAIAVLCDGMGGMTGGERASKLCSELVYQSFYRMSDYSAMPEFYRAVIDKADSEVKALKADDGSAIRAGTTMVSVAVIDDMLYWASVGDSHAYIIHDNEIMCLTRDHNLMMLMEEKIRRGEMTREEAEQNPQKEALVSFIGIGGVRYTDINTKPFKLISGDYIVLCSDGLYRTVSEAEIKQVISRNRTDARHAAVELTELAMSKGYKYQDNTSVVVIAYTEQV